MIYSIVKHEHEDELKEMVRKHKAEMETMESTYRLEMDLLKQKQADQMTSFIKQVGLPLRSSHSLGSISENVIFCFNPTTLSFPCHSFLLLWCRR